MGKRTALEESFSDIILFCDGILRINLVDALLAQSDVEYMQLTDEILILCEKERQLRLLQREGSGGTDGVGAYIISIVFRHKTRKASGKGLVDARAEKTINNQHVFLQYGWVEFLGYLNKLMDALAFLQPLFVGSTIG